MTTFICIWPDGTWCYQSEAEEFIHKSDDYFIAGFPDTASEDDIDNAVGKWYEGRTKYVDQVVHV